MNTLAKKLPVLIITICSLFAINSCASAPKTQENLPLVEEEQKAEAQKTDSTSTGDAVNSEDSQNKNEEENSVQIEKINEDEILDNETESAVSSTDFTEPEVLDALIEEPLEEAEKENEDSINENSETENILPEQEEQTEDEAELTQTENSSLESEEPAIKAEAEPAQVEENNSTEAETFATVDAENTQLPEENLTDSATTGESDNSAETENAQTKESESLQNDIVVPSRTMTVKNAQYVDVVYPGRGWIYIGEEGENEDKLFRYFGRKLGSEDTTFTVRSIKSGKTLLHFYKNDVLTGSYIDDYLEIQVTDENASANERITAPSYAEVVPKKVSTAPTEKATQKQSAPTKGEENSINAQKETPPQAEKTTNSTDEETKTNNGLTAVVETTAQNNIQNIQPQNTEPKTEVKTADTKNSKTSKKNNSSSSLLEQAKESLKNKDYENALEEIQEYLDTQNTKIDEALYVQGQILEADSNVRNIKSSIDSYDSLIKHYPASKFWQDANKRKIYLKRYYISIY